MKRNCGVDLYRIVLMLMICISHVLGKGGVLGSSTNVLNFYAVWALESLCICGVDGYALISGYVYKNQGKNNKIFRLWMIVVFYCVIDLILTNKIYNKSNCNLVQLVKCFMPVCNNKYWYFSCYFLLYLLMPFLNKLLESLNYQESKKLFLILIFSSFMTITNFNWFSNGFSVLWLIELYLLGGIISKTNFLIMFKKIPNTIYFSLYLFSSFITWFCKICLNIDSFGLYTSPSVLFSAIFLLLLFSKLDIDNDMIVRISSLTFGIYLFHASDFFIKIFIENKFVRLQNEYFIFAIIYSIIIGIIIFIVSAIIEYLRNIIFKILKIDNLNKKICIFLETVLKK